VGVVGHHGVAHLLHVRARQVIYIFSILMKRFLHKASLYLAILLAIILPVSAWLFRQMPGRLMLVSNSVSYNLKADFVRQHREKLSKAGLVVVGSSLSLNNVSAKMLQDSLGLPTINLSSWALNIQNFQNSPLWDEKKMFLINIGIADFGDPPSVEIKDNFSFHTTRAREWLNFLTDIRTFLGMREQTRKILAIQDNTDYNSCHFDECGSVLFSVAGFRYDKGQWDADNFDAWGVDSVALTAYVRRLRDITVSHHGYSHLVVSFSPLRRKFYNQRRAGLVAYLGQLIRENCPNTTFIDLYDRNYPDSDYVDHSHFNILGANRFTGELIDSIRAKGLIGR